MKNLIALVVVILLLAIVWTNRVVLRAKLLTLMGVPQEYVQQEAPVAEGTPAPVVVSTPPPTPAATPQPVAVATTPAPVSPEKPATPAATPAPRTRVWTPSELVTAFRDSLVFVTGEGSGSGFIANMGGRQFLITNAHVAAGVRGATFTTLKGTPIKAGPASVAVGHDIFAMEITATGTGTAMEVMREVDSNVSVSDEVVVLGNTEGGGVVTTLPGQIVGIGPNLVEINALFQPGNSGSPIIHMKSGKVIGVASYLTFRKYDPATRQADPVTRRFGYRVDSVKTWQPMNWAAFQAQARQMEAVEKLTEDLVAFIKDVAPDGRVSTGMHTNPAIRSRIDGWLSSKSRFSSAKDSAAADQNFISFLKSASRADVENLRPQLTYDYFQRQLADEERERGEIAQAFDLIIERARNMR